MKYCTINGIPQSTIALDNRGLAYGDGLFTTAKIEDGGVVLLNAHIQRLVDGCNLLGIPLPSIEQLTQFVTQAAKAHDFAVLKVMVISGSGGRGYSRKGMDVSNTQVIVVVSDYPTHYLEMAKIGCNLTDSRQQISISPMLSGIKHLNRLEQVLLRQELDQQSADDLVVTNCQGNVIETTCANIFYWLEGQLFTPALSHSGVNGIIRQQILSLMPEVKIVETSLTTLTQSQSIFICNSLMGIMPINSYNGKSLAIEKPLAMQANFHGKI